MPSLPPPLTLILRNKNAADILPQTLSALFSQNYQNFQLWVVDSGSTDDSLEILSQYPCRIECISAGDYYPGPVLNQMVAQSQTPWVGFLNSDAVMLGPQTLREMVAALDAPGVQAVFARQLPRPEAASWVRQDYARAFPATAPTPPWMPMSLPLALMRRSAWEAHPFYRWAWGSEDTEWGTWARSEGYLVRYVPSAQIMHSHNYSLRQLYGRRFIEGEADALIQGPSFGWQQMLRRGLGSVLRDLSFDLREREWADLLRIVPRRAVEQWAYYRGRTWGAQRLAQQLDDPRHGQEVVLSRYDR